MSTDISHPNKSPVPSGRTVLPLSPSHQRDFAALRQARTEAQRNVIEMNTRILLLGRTVIGAAFDPDELESLGWDLDLEDGAVGVVLTPPTHTPIADKDM